MATAQLSPLLGYIRKLAVGRTSPQSTDRQLLDNFSTRRDEAAFATLVSRHGPMVLRVCRRVLNHEQDAEDAFQATFLVLARNTSSIRKREALAGWLHGVAFRIAMEVKRKAGRRRNHEARLWNVMSKAAISPTWDDVQAVLDEEIRRLPETLRTAFVLCVLEGKSGPKAAAELGVKEGTVSSRLTRARQRLQQRLVRRGIELSALLAAMSVAESGVKAVPVLLTGATVRAGVLVATGGSAAGAIPSHIAALAAGVTRAMFLTKAKMVSGVVLAVGLCAAGASVLARPALASKSADLSVAGTKLAKDSSEQPPVKRHIPRQAASDKDSMTYSGQVLGPDGKPVAGAKVYYYFITLEGEPIPVRATTATDGRFSFRLSRRDVPQSADATQSDPLKTGHVVVKADGFTFGWRSVSMQTADLSFHVSRDDTPIEGRILDLEGKPLAGLRVSVLSMAASDNGDLTPFHEALKAREPLHTGMAKHLPNHFYNSFIYRPHFIPILPTARTDAGGKFHLKGFAKEQVIELRIEGPTIETQSLFVLTRAQPAGAESLLTAPRSRAQAEPTKQASVRWNGFDHTAAPGQVVVGTVRDEKTNEPIPHAIVESYMLAGTNLAQNAIYRTMADDKGRYRFTGLPRGQGNSIRIHPPKDQPYLPIVKSVPATNLLAEERVDAELPRGVFVELTAKDKTSGEPVVGSVSYFALPEKPDPGMPFSRPFADSYDDMMPIRNDGTFRFVAVAGRAIVAFRTDWLKYPIAQEAATIRLPSLISPWNYQAFVEINPKTGDESVKVEFVLDAGRMVKGKLVGPNGEPISGALATGLRDDWSNVLESYHPLETAEFTALGVNRPRLLCFVHLDKKLAGSVVARGDEKRPITVKMVPWGTVSGRLLDTEGKPIKNATLSFTEVPVRKPGQAMSLDTGLHVVQRFGGQPTADPVTDEQGRFCVERLVPGLNYNLALIDAKGATEYDQIRWTGLVFTNLILKSGETKNLGDVKLQPFPKK